jgi:hypothetical protein
MMRLLRYIRIYENIRDLYRAWQRRRYTRWARQFAARTGLPFAGIMLLRGYRTHD